MTNPIYNTERLALAAFKLNRRLDTPATADIEALARLADDYRTDGRRHDSLQTLNDLIYELEAVAQANPCDQAAELLDGATRLAASMAANLA